MAGSTGAGEPGLHPSVACGRCSRGGATRGPHSDPGRELPQPQGATGYPTLKGAGAGSHPAAVLCGGHGCALPPAGATAGRAFWLASSLSHHYRASWGWNSPAAFGGIWSGRVTVTPTPSDCHLRPYLRPEAEWNRAETPLLNSLPTLRCRAPRSERRPRWPVAPTSRPWCRRSVAGGETAGVAPDRPRRHCGHVRPGARRCPDERCRSAKAPRPSARPPPHGATTRLPSRAVDIVEHGPCRSRRWRCSSGWTLPFSCPTTLRCASIGVHDRRRGRGGLRQLPVSSACRSRWTVHIDRAA